MIFCKQSIVVNFKLVSCTIIIVALHVQVDIVTKLVEFKLWIHRIRSIFLYFVQNRDKGAFSNVSTWVGIQIPTKTKHFVAFILADKDVLISG